MAPTPKEEDAKIRRHREHRRTLGFGECEASEEEVAEIAAAFAEYVAGDMP